MSFEFINGRFTALDATGTPIVGALLYSYINNTVTPLPTYTDASLGVANTNPAVTDSRGEIQAWIGAGVYQFVLKDPLGNTIWSVNDIFDLQLKLATSTGASGVGFQQVGSDVERDIEKKLQEYISLKDYGAVLDGVTDDSAALVKANIRSLALGTSIVFEGTCHVGTATVISARIYDTKNQIFSLTSQVTINNGAPVRPEWWGVTNENIVHLAGLSLPSQGGVVQLSNTTYKKNNHVYNGKYWNKDHVVFRGAQVPKLATDCKSLVNGTIIQGTFLNFANNTSFENLGIDCGFTYTSTINGGTATDAFVNTYNSDAAKTANASVNGLNVHNIIGLANSPTDAVHAIILAEGVYGTIATGDICGVYGIHGVVIKATNLRADTLRAYCQSGDGVIIKTDAQTTSVASDIQIGKIVSYANGPEGWSPYVTPSASSGTTFTGLRFHCFAGNVFGVQIGEYINNGYDYGMDVVITPALGYALDNVQIGSISTRNNATTGANLFAENSGGALLRFQIGRMINRDTPTGCVCVWTTISSVQIGSLYTQNCTNAGLAASASAGPVVNTLYVDNCAAAYQITSLGKPVVGKTLLINGSSVYYQTSGSGQSVSLSNSWAQVVGGDSFNVIPTNYGIQCNGLLSGGTANVIMTLPQFARPPTEKRMMLQGRSGGTQAAIPVVVGADGVVTINDASGSIANVSSYVSLAGLSYSISN